MLVCGGKAMCFNKEKFLNPDSKYRSVFIVFD